MKNDWLAEAINNNAAWCDAVATSHGINASWINSVWYTENTMPPLYPNIITLEAEAEIHEFIDAIESRIPQGWGIKDSYAEFDLIGRGFKLAFKALWYYREPFQVIPDARAHGAQLKSVRTQSELDRWTTAWGEGKEIFKLSLLENTSIELVYLERKEEIVAGMAVNQSGESVGISNIFGQQQEIIGCVSAVIDTHPAKGIVGYGDRDELVALSAIGFQDIGELQVWLCK